ncbi:MAG: phosphate regulon sensor histidine kinase PhoR [Methylotenera sp.]|uniref:phosphate regulon sensor histidine kinase PhoR n=1 Tax=Methylotenera sp. TaxID=2051956 RepID=UPI00248A4D61|nr:phosphate regulon sensor histidine kinase PhoR [Methylotenera sp.]MDI1310219.1 phosphate regulon sensor histidine kinase PhoR [Methylotenera sp.]
MLDIRWKAGLFVCALSAICLFFWLITSINTALIVFAAGLLIYLISHVYWLHTLQNWFKNPSIKEIPEGSGVWEDIFIALLKYERNNNQNQKQLNAALERFNLATSAMPDGLVILSASNEIEWCTPNAEHQLGLNLATDKMLPLVNLIRNSHFIAYLYNEKYDEPFKLKSWRNSEVILEIQLIPFANNQKLLICRDMTQHEKVDVMRRDFIANVSHELRTPLTVVGGFLETLSDMEGAVPDNLKNYFAMMEDQTIRMRRIIEDLLTLSTIESNTEEPDDSEIDMSSLLKSVQNDGIGLSQGLNKAKHIIHLEADSRLNLIGAVDELRSVFSNLVSNAIRYTPTEDKKSGKTGEIFIRWALQNGEPVFSVRDTGIGIEQQHIDRLTERFYRVDRSRSRETGGTGLGLSIVKHILIRHQAKLEITSELGVGSTFSAVFPKARIALKK